MLGVGGGEPKKNVSEAAPGINLTPTGASGLGKAATW